MTVRTPIKAIVCDFDGTFSTLRCGWEDVMKRMMPKHPTVIEPRAVTAIGVFGDDWRGAALKGLLKKAGADVSGVVTDPTRVSNTYVKHIRKGFADNVVYEDPRLDFANYDPLSPTAFTKIACCCSAVTIKKLKTTGTASRAELKEKLK